MSATKPRSARREGALRPPLLLLSFWTIASALASPTRVRAEEESDAELADVLRRIPPTPASDARATFRLHPDFSIELAAAEPDVVDPVAMAFDELGRAYVVEMRDYPFTLEEGSLTESETAKNQPSGRVRLLEDEDGDGRFDRSRVFLDGLHWPTAVACWKGGAVIAAAPEIIFARDRDGDGAADERRVLFEGFGTRNVQALVNGLQWGPDVRLWGLNGGNGGQVRSLLHPSLAPVDVRGRDFRFRPGEPLETVAGSGGQFGLSFDGFGRRFVCSNSQHVRQVVLDGHALDHNAWLGGIEAAATIAVDGGAAPVFRTSRPEPWRVVRTRWRRESANASRYPPTELVPIGFFTSATGILIYRGDAYGDEWKGTVFIGDVGGNLVHRKRLRSDGAAYAAARAPEEASLEFLTSTDNWFRPVQLVEGPKGCIYILDMYRETIEHPYSLPDRIKRHLSLTSGNDRGRIWRLVRKGVAPRARARFPADAESLAALLDRADGWTRTTASRLLVEAGAKDGAPALREILAGGRHPEGRAGALGVLAALESLERHDLERALADPSPEVVESALLRAEDLDRVDSVIDAVLPLATHDGARVRLAAALALGRSADSRAPRALATIALRDRDDRWIRAAILAGDPTRAGWILAELAESGSRGDGIAALVRELGAIAGASGDHKGGAAALRAFEGASGGSAGLASEFLAGFSRGLRRAGRSLAGVLEAETKRGESHEGGLAGAVNDLLASSRRRALDPGASPDVRASALRVLAFDPDPSALDLLGVGLAPERTLGEHEAALDALTERAGTESARVLIPRWPSLSPALRQRAAEALFREPGRVALLIRAIEGGDLALGDFEPRRREQLVAAAPPELQARARKLLEAAGASDRAAVVDAHRGVLDLEGDPGRGRTTFDRACATCHRAEGRGHEVGPDLETVSGRAPADLLLHILDPNRETQPQYTVYTAVLRDGRIATGIIASENEASVTLRRADGIDEPVFRSEIQELRSNGVSLMPENLEQTVPSQDLADLIAYIRALSARDGAPSPENALPRPGS